MNRLLVLTAAAAALSACASMEPPRGRGADAAPTVFLPFEAVLQVIYDSNGDRRVSRAEAAAGAAQSFSTADADKDGALRPMELQAWCAAEFGEPSAFTAMAFGLMPDQPVPRAAFVTGLSDMIMRHAGPDGTVGRGDMIQKLQDVMAARRQRQGAPGGGQGGPPQR